MDFADWKTKWANIRETTGNEVDVGGAESSTGLIEVMIRYDKDLFDIGKNAETYRLRFSTIATNQTHSQYYNILRVSEFEGRKRFMKLICNRVR
ncbi:head-tail adaptor protein [Neptunomonas sp.]|uniref:phage head completion protein n=1 Tax=Neptunomonas sp. TaxID=1971898 RepID=UPI003563AAE2